MAQGYNTLLNGQPETDGFAPVRSDAAVMTSDQLRREASYRIAISIMGKLLSDGAIAKHDARQIEQIAGQKFSPVWGANAPLF